MQPSDTGRDLLRPGAAEAPSDSSQRKDSKLRPRNWRVPQRLAALVLIPTIAAIVLGGLRISASTSSADAYGKVERLASLGGGITALVHELSAERDLTAGYIAAGRDRAFLSPVQDQYKKVDAQARRVRGLAGRIDGSFGAGTSSDVRNVVSRLDGIKALRSLAVDGKVPAFTIIEKYGSSIDQMIGPLDGLSQDVADDNLAASSRALGSLARAKEQISQERALLYVGSLTGRLEPDELTGLLASRAREDSEIESFRASASVVQRQRLDDTVVGTEIDVARAGRQSVLSAATSGNGKLPEAFVGEQGSGSLRESMTAMIDKMRTVEKGLGDEILKRSQDEKSAAQRSFMIDSGVAVILLLMVLLVTVFMARSLVRPLHRLRDRAHEVAGTRLPSLVERLRDPQAAAAGIEVEPIDIDSTDEIGQVARAFDEVHREAVRLAADEAALRGNINAMFVNLSRRSQSLIERQLRLIDELEQGERDDERLASLFRLDHLATRMRRNCENLLVLGGQEQARRWNQPVPLIDIVRASLSEVEQYERVGLRIQGEVSVVGPVVNDLVHLVAELVENATGFSPEHTKVAVSGHLLSGGGAMVQISDNGVGMAAEDLQSANWRLANPPVVDFSAARRMGLFVVGRLAVRHGIRVELRSALSGGLTAFVLLPAGLITQGESVGGTPRRFGAAGVEPPSVTAVRPAASTGAIRPTGGQKFATGGQPAITGPVPLPRPAAAPHRAAQPVAENSGPAWVAEEQPPPVRPAPRPWETGPQQPVGDTGSQPAVRDTGSQPVFRDTGTQPAIRDTGTQPAVRDTGTQPAIRDTGTQPAVRDTGSQPVFRDTGTQPAVRDTGAQPVFRDTGTQPAVRDTGAQPVVRPGAPQPPGRQGPPPFMGQPAPRPGSPDSTATGPLPGFPAGAVPPFDQPPPQQQGPAVAWGPPEPAPPPEPMRTAGRSPIFDAMESEWFQRRTGGASGDEGAPVWQSPADAGFHAAEALREPANGGLTSSGLPKRVPGRNRLPGSVGAQAPTPPPQPAAQPAEFVRNRFASLQQGVFRGRAETVAEPNGEIPQQGDREIGGAE